MSKALNAQMRAKRFQPDPEAAGRETPSVTAGVRPLPDPSVSSPIFRSWAGPHFQTISNFGRLYKRTLTPARTTKDATPKSSKSARPRLPAKALPSMFNPMR